MAPTVFVVFILLLLLVFFSVCIEGALGVFLVGTAGVGEDEREVNQGEPDSSRIPAIVFEGFIYPLSNQPQQLFGVRREQGNTGDVK